MRTHQKKKSEWTYLPPKLVGTVSKNYSTETAQGPYWKPFIIRADDGEPDIDWMTYRAS